MIVLVGRLIFIFARFITIRQQLLLFDAWVNPFKIPYDWTCCDTESSGVRIYDFIVAGEAYIMVKLALVLEGLFEQLFIFLVIFDTEGHLQTHENF